MAIWRIYSSMVLIFGRWWQRLLWVFSDMQNIIEHMQHSLCQVFCILLIFKIVLSVGSIYTSWGIYCIHRGISWHTCGKADDCIAHTFPLCLLYAFANCECSRKARECSNVAKAFEMPESETSTNISLHDLVCKAGMQCLQLVFTFMKVPFFIMNVCDEPANLNVEMLNFFFRVTHFKMKICCTMCHWWCPGKHWNILARILQKIKVWKKVYSTTSSHVQWGGCMTTAMALYLSSADWMALDCTWSAFVMCFRSL